MKVAMISSWRTKCGIAHYAKSLASSLEDLGVKISPISEEFWNKNSLFFPVQITKGIRGVDPDIVHFQHEHTLYGASAYSIPPMILPKLLRKLGWEVVTTIHSVFPRKSQDIFYLKRKVRNTFMRFLAESSAVIVHLDRARDSLVKDFNFDSDRIYVIPHGTEVRSPSESWSSNKLLYFGFIFPEKGIEHTIDAMPLILKENPDLKLRIVGETHPDDDRGRRYLKFLKRKVKELKLEDSVSFLGYLPEEELSEEISEAFVCIFPYKKAEGEIYASGPLVKAAGFGKPIICTSILCGVASGENCMVVPPEDSKSIAEAVSSLLSDRKLTRGLGKNARKSLALSWEKSAERHLDVYKSILNREIVGK